MLNSHRINNLTCRSSALRATVVLMLCLVVHTLQVSAQDVRHDVTLDDVVVVSQRRMKDVGVEKTLLDTMALRENVSLSMADILSKNSTLFIKSYGRATESTAEFRGTSPSHTQVTWNGMKINSPMFGTVDFSTIPAYFIDEATLYHGGSSINITGGGLGGAIELSTKPVADNGLHAQYVLGVGAFDTYDNFLRLTYRKARWQTSTRVVVSTSDNDYTYTNHDKKVDVRDDMGNIISSYHPKERNKSGYFTDVHALHETAYDMGSKGRLSLSLWYTHSKRGLPFLSVDYKDDADFLNEHKSDVLRSVLSWNRHSDNLSLCIKGGYILNTTAYDYYTTRKDATNNITSSESTTHTAFASVSADWSITPTLLLTANTSAYYNHVDSRDKSPYHIGSNYNRGRTDVDANIQLRWRPLADFTIAGVLRDESHGNKLIPVIPALFVDYVLYRPLNIVIKASVSRNYRYPSMDDLYFQPGGNPDLKPERGVSYDAGIEFSVKTSRRFLLRGNASLYNSYIKDWILWTPNTKGYWEPSNVSKVHSYGLEATLAAQMLVSKDMKIDASANYAWTPSKNQGERVNANDHSYGRQLCYVPLYSANCNVHASWRSWRVGCQWSCYSDRYTTTSNEVSHISGRLLPYYMTDVSIEKTLRCFGVDWALKAVVNNLLNTEYVTVLSHPMPGRNAEFYVTVKL